MSRDHTSLLPPDALAVFELSGHEYGEAEVIETSSPFGKILRLSTWREPPAADRSMGLEHFSQLALGTWNQAQLAVSRQWQIRARIYPSVSLRMGQLVVASFWIRCTKPKERPGMLRLVVETNDPPYTKSAWYMVRADLEWRRANLPFRVACDMEQRSYRLELWMGFPPQTVEIAELTVDSFGSEVLLDDLAPDVAYLGRASGEAWREEAAERIERYRKGNLTIRVVDLSGLPIQGANVSVRLKRHTFCYGTAVASEQLLGREPDDEMYRKTLLEHFNGATPENELKWLPWEGHRRRALWMVAWLRANGLSRIRGHNLVWSYWNEVPIDLREPSITSETIRKRIRAHIHDIVPAFRGGLVDWDVLNEFSYYPDLLTRLDMRTLVDIFNWASECDPDVDLSVNESRILNSDDISNQNAYFDLIEFLLANGAPVDSIGIEAHFGYQLASPREVWHNLDRFGAFGKKLRITEFDVDVCEEQLQADYTRDFLTAVFAHPSVDSFTFWGFWEGRMYRPGAALFRRDWSIKANGEVYRDLVFRQWRTDVKTRTGEDGTVTVRGFLGDYEICAQADQDCVIGTTTLPSTGEVVTLRMGRKLG